ncbi:hypothetical protein [Chryseobacterium daeguense]|uniref:hypothetical protein n=1 Tax=Chryseobacterium daeguense TaxID=412438 RepID=UPI0004812A45|nr:hypothetical protein [Chryseobacterium daeguense]
MNPETHKQQLQELFPDEKFVYMQTRSLYPTEAKINIKRELTRLEIGHCFSLGMTGIKRSGEGVNITFDLQKASLNFQ